MNENPKYQSFNSKSFKFFKSKPHYASLMHISKLPLEIKKNLKIKC